MSVKGIYIRLVGKVLNLSKTSIRVLELLLNEGEMTLNEISEKLKLSRRTIYNHLSNLSNLELVHRKAGERGGRLIYIYYLNSIDKVLEVAYRTLSEKMKLIEDSLKKVRGDRIVGSG